MVVGVAVSPEALPADGLVAVRVPAGRYAIYDVDSGHPERVGDRWRDVWADGTIAKSYLCDYERYQPNGEIAIHVGVR
jgi:predicted transcriptional regulator YdeE